MVNELDNFLENYTGTKASVEKRFMTRGTIELASPICQGKDVLQMGLGNGMVAKYLDKIVLKQTIIEGSSKILEKFSFKSNKTDFINTFFEKYKSRLPTLLCTVCFTDVYGYIMFYELSAI